MIAELHLVEDVLQDRIKKSTLIIDSELIPLKMEVEEQPCLLTSM
jgi:hypothetical protein